MKARYAVLGALAMAVTLASVAAGGTAATKQRVAITFTFHKSTFVLAPFGAGALKRDSGWFPAHVSFACREVVRDGQKATVCTGGQYTLTGKRGTLTIEATQEWVNPGYSAGCGVAFGTWKVVAGTGVYTGIAGGGRSAYDAHCEEWYARHEGFLVSR